MAKGFTYEFDGEVSGGRLDPAVAVLIGNALRRLDGRRVLLTLREWTKPRSLAQNAYWFAVLEKHAVPAFRDYGDNWTAWKVHEHVMEELGYQEVLTGKNGKLTVARKHSSEFTSKEWEEFMERARAHLAAEHGISLPLPKEKSE